MGCGGGLSEGAFYVYPCVHKTRSPKYIVLCLCMYLLTVICGLAEPDIEAEIRSERKRSIAARECTGGMVQTKR